MTSPGRSTAVRVAAAVAAVEGLVLVGTGVVYAVSSVVDEAASALGAGVGAVLIGAAGVLLLVAARGVLLCRWWARSPVVVVQLLLALTAFSLLRTMPVAAVAGMVMAVTALAALASPQGRGAFQD